MENKLLSSRYQIIQSLGKGGFGKTYLAEDRQRPGNPKCVVKQLHPAGERPNFLELARRLFNKEAETLEKLGIHPQIPRLLAYFEQEQEFYLVQEYIDGRILSEELISGQPWTESKVIDLLRDCLGIVDFVHTQGVIHRDIKPDNLIRRRQDNKLVLVDFGSVKEVIVAQTQLNTSTIAIGTRGYMPIEQARGKPRFSSDIYALGIIAIQALTGVHPLELSEDENGEIIWQSQCSSQLAKIVSQMVRYHFKDRYQSAKEILEKLDILSNYFLNIPVTETIQNYSTENIPSIPKQDISTFAEVKKTETTISNSSKNTSTKGEALVTSSLSSLIDNQAISVSQPISQSDSSLAKEVKILSHPTSQFGSSTKFPTKTILSIVLLVGTFSTGGMYILNKNSGQEQAEIEQILQTLKTQYQEKNYQECYDLASDNNTQAIGLSKVKINEWSGKCGLGAAQQQAEAKEYAAALNIAKKLAQEVPNYQEVQQNIDVWSEKVLELAIEKYTKQGKLEEASQTILTIIPDRSSVKPKALELKAQWEKENQTNKAIIESAKGALQEQKWQDAKNEAAKLKNSSFYWQQQAQTIIDEADRAIRLDLPTIDLCQEAAELCN